MTTGDGTSGVSDDGPLDLTAVADDEAALERVRARTVAADDPALALLRDLLDDVGTDLPQSTPVGIGTTVVAFAAADERSASRRVRRSTVVVSLTATLLSVGGVAAASTLAPVDSPLHDLGSAVRSAAGAVVGAVTPPESSARRAVASPSPTATPTATPTAAAATVTAAPTRPPAPGATVAAASRSQAAARQVAQLLDQAQQLLADGRTAAATQRLDVAERKLAEVLPGDGAAALRSRLAALRSQVAAAPTPAPKPSRTAKAPAEPAPAKADKDPEPKGRDEARSAPTKKAGRSSPLGQLSRDASTKPRQ